MKLLDLFSGIGGFTQCKIITDTDTKGLQGFNEGKGIKRKSEKIAGLRNSNVKNSRKIGCGGRMENRRQILERGFAEIKNAGSDWTRNWIKIATEFCGVDAGIPDRIHRIKSLGNSIVPQVAYEILKSIKEIENAYSS